MRIHTIHLIALLLAVLPTACAPVAWEMKVNNLDNQQLVWPPAPNQSKISYVGEISAFTQIDKSFVSMLFGQSEAGKIGRPVAVAFGNDSRVAIVDAGRKGVHFFIPAQKKYLLLTRAGATDFATPVSVAFDASLQLYISDSALGKVLMFDQNGDFKKELLLPGQTKFKRPTGLSYQDGTQLLYVVDTLDNKVHFFGEQGAYQGGFGQRGAGGGQFNLPTHIATSSNARVYVNDAMNFRTQIFAAPEYYISKFGRHGNGSGDFAMPKGIAVDRWGVVYVAETLFDRVQLFSEKGEYLMALGAKGSKPGEFWMPSGIFINPDDTLYVCDTYNRRIQVFQLYSRLGGK